MNNLHLLIEAVDHLEKYQGGNALELLCDNYPISDNELSDDSDSNDNIDPYNQYTVLNISMGEKNGQKKNAPQDSKNQSYIYIHLDNQTIKRGSGWHVWEKNGNWYHLGGNKNRKPTIYKLNTNQRFGWSKINDQSDAPRLYNLYGNV
jgi:hypothetical protein